MTYCQKKRDFALYGQYEKPWLAKKVMCTTRHIDFYELFVFSQDDSDRAMKHSKKVRK